MAVYSATLNGKTRFKDIWGNWVRWDDRWIETFNTNDHSGSALDADFELKGGNWKIKLMKVAGDDGGIARIVDIDGKSGRRIDFLQLDVSSDVTLQSTQVKLLKGSSDGDRHTITLGDAQVDFIQLDGALNIVKTGSEWVDTIDTSGRGRITVNEGGAGTVKAYTKADKLTVNAGFVEMARMREGNDAVLVKGDGGIGALDTGDGRDKVVLNNGHVNALETGNGRDVVTVRNGSNIRSAYLDDGADSIRVAASNVDQIWLGAGNNNATIANGSHVFFLFADGGNNTVTLSGDSRLNSLELGNGTHVVDVRDTSQIQHMKFYDSTVTVTTGGDWADGIQAGGNTRVDLTLGSGGAGNVRLGDGADTVDATAGHIEFLATRSGNDSVTLGSQGAGTVKTGDGADEVTTGAGWIELVTTGRGRDMVNVLGDVETVATGDGSDTVTVTGAVNVNRVSLGHGNDSVTTGANHVTLLEAWSGTNTFTVGSGGAGTVRGGDGTDIVTTGNGWVETISTGNGDDTVNLGSAASVSVRLGDGDDTLVLAESPDRGGRYDGGEGNDTLDFSAWTSGITFTLDATGWQNPAAPGGVLNDVANNTGYLIEARFENVIGTDQADAITGDEYDNSFTGNLGADVFTFTATNWDPTLGAGTDSVADFEDGTDLLRLPGQSFGALTIVDDGANLRVTHANGEIILEGLAGTTLTAADFLFA